MILVPSFVMNTQTWEHWSYEYAVPHSVSLGAQATDTVLLF